MEAKVLIKELISKYDLPNNINLFYEKDSIKIEGDNTINSYNLENKYIINVVKN